MGMNVKSPGKMPDKPLRCEELVDILKRKLKGEKGIARKWLRCKIKQLDMKLTK
jgi:hypothetical protein